MFVFSYATGQPVPAARVQLFSDENEALDEASTDGSGLASVRTSAKAVWLMAQVEGDLHALPFREHNIQTGAFGVPTRWDGNEADDGTRVALFTDRDVYRPGESVYLKAVVRELAESGWRVPEGIVAKITATDAREREFFATNSVLTATGACEAALPLPLGPRGPCQITLRLPGNRGATHAITTADYQPAAFAIDLRPKAAYARAEPIQLPVSAHYFFGKALSAARVHWTVQASDGPLAPKDFAAFTFARAAVESQWGRGSGTFAASGEGRITGASNCLVTLDVPLNPTAPQPRAVSLLVEVTDLNQQTITRSAEFLKHSSAFYLGCKRFEDVLEAGSVLPVEIAVIGPDETPWGLANLRADGTRG